jgi:hypothetical protein
MSMIIEKKDIPTIKRKTKIPFIAVSCGLIDFVIWIRAKVEHRGCILENSLIHAKLLIPWTLKDAYTIPI